MLIAVLRAARRMKSDYEKATLLIESLDGYIADDDVRAAYLATTATITSDYERQRVLLALIARDDVPDYAVADLVNTASGISGEYAKATLLATLAKSYSLDDEEARDAYFRVVGTISSNVERERALGAVLRQRDLDPLTAIAALAATAKMTSNIEKANVLTLLARSPLLDEEDVRDAFLEAAQTIDNDWSYRTVMSALMKRGK